MKKIIEYIKYGRRKKHWSDADWELFKSMMDSSGIFEFGMEILPICFVLLLLSGFFLTLAAVNYF